MKTLLLTISQLFIIGYCACSQSYLGETKQQVSRNFHLDKKIKFEIITTDSTITYHTNNPNYTKTSKVFHFNKQGKCDCEAMTFECNECYQSELNKIISHSKWIKADSLKYITKRGKKLELITHYQGQPYVFVVKGVNKG